MSNPQAFIEKIAPYAQEIQRKYGIPASVAIAQACLETGYGESAKGNNLFNIKGDYQGQSYTIRTNEYRADGSAYVVTAAFRKYGTVDQSFEDYAKFLGKDRYRGAFNYTNDPKAFIREVHRAGYATSPNYTDQVTSVMRRYHLTQYDDPHASPLMRERVDFTGRYQAGKVTDVNEISAEEQLRRQLLYSLGYERKNVDAMPRDALLGDAFMVKFTFGLIRSLVEHLGKSPLTTNIGAMASVENGRDVSPLATGTPSAATRGLAFKPKGVSLA